MKSALQKIITELKHRTFFYLLVAFVTFNLILAAYSVIIRNFYAIKGQAGFVLLGILLYAVRAKLKMGRLTYFILLTGFALHVSHIFGNFYYRSPIVIPWDYLTHIIPFIGFTLLFFNLQKSRIDTAIIFSFTNVLLFVMLFLTIGGIGVLIEVGEYAGYALLGMQDGALLFGGGDFSTIVVTSDVAEEMGFHGGGWYDSMSDLLINSYTTLFTLVVLFGNYFYRHRKK